MSNKIYIHISGGTASGTTTMYETIRRALIEEDFNVVPDLAEDRENSPMYAHSHYERVRTIQERPTEIILRVSHARCRNQLEGDFTPSERDIPPHRRIYMQTRISPPSDALEDFDLLGR